MSSLFDPRNPDAAKQLGELVQSLPSMVMEQINGRTSRPKANGFTRFCPICALQYARSKVYAAPELKEGVCEGCRKQLLDGCTALVTAGGRWAMVKHPNLPAGKILRVSDKLMDGVEREKKAQEGGE